MNDYCQFGTKSEATDMSWGDVKAKQRFFTYNNSAKMRIRVTGMRGKSLPKNLTYTN